MSAALVATSSGLFRLSASGAGGKWKSEPLVSPKEPIMALVAERGVFGAALLAGLGSFTLTGFAPRGRLRRRLEEIAAEEPSEVGSTE